MTEHIPGDNLIIWEFDYAMTTFYEVDTDLITSLLPKELSPMEIVPGVSLLNITAFNFPEGGLGHLPNFQELIAAIVVAPDLSRGVPKFAMYVFSLGSTNQEHLDHSADYYKLPSYDKLEYGKISHEKNEADFGDNDGSILTMNNCCETIGDYLDHERYFQAFVSKGDDVYIADLYLKAALFEHQEQGEVGIINNHPFLKGLELFDEVSVPYLQMILEPGTKGKQFYYKPEKYS